MRNSDMHFSDNKVKITRMLRQFRVNENSTLPQTKRLEWKNEFISPAHSEFFSSRFL
jgi:hypothetical protein